MTAPTRPILQHGTVVTDRMAPTWTERHNPHGLTLDMLAGLAIRNNPKRAQLIVSRVLGKHIPVAPSIVRATGALLAAQVDAAVTGTPYAGPVPDQARAWLTDPSRAADVEAWLTHKPARTPVVVVGFCETATALGHVVADAFATSTYVHTTRRPDPNLPVLLRFDEEHSHAVAHYLQIGSAAFDTDAPVVLVDDELTTGTTALNTIAELQQVRARSQYVIATLLDLRDDHAVAAFEERAAAMGVTVHVVALLAGSLRFPADALQRAAAFRAQNSSEPIVAGPARTRSRARFRADTWSGVPVTARHGFLSSDRHHFDTQVALLADDVASALAQDPHVLVVGTEEIMYLPTRLAGALGPVLGRAVPVQSTTRSPVLAYDQRGYAVRRTVEFPAPDDPTRRSLLHNAAPLAWDMTDGPVYTDIVVVTDTSASAAMGLARALQTLATRSIQVVPVGTGQR